MGYMYVQIAGGSCHFEGDMVQKMTGSSTPYAQHAIVQSGMLAGRSEMNGLNFRNIFECVVLRKVDMYDAFRHIKFSLTFLDTAYWCMVLILDAGTESAATPDIGLRNIS